MPTSAVMANAVTSLVRRRCLEVRSLGRGTAVCASSGMPMAMISTAEFRENCVQALRVAGLPICPPGAERETKSARHLARSARSRGRLQPGSTGFSLAPIWQASDPSGTAGRVCTHRDEGNWGRVAGICRPDVMGVLSSAEQAQWEEDGWCLHAACCRPRPSPPPRRCCPSSSRRRRSSPTTPTRNATSPFGSIRTASCRASPSRTARSTTSSCTIGSSTWPSSCSGSPTSGSTRPC